MNQNCNFSLSVSKDYLIKPRMPMRGQIYHSLEFPLDPDELVFDRPKIVAQFFQ